MKQIEKILNGVYFIIIAIIILVVFGSIYGIKIYITMSGSMEPVIQTGSICIVDTNAKYEAIQIDDVIAFSTNGQHLVTHRVISIQEQGIETKGDNNNVSDGITTTKDNFKGKTICSIPYIGYIIYCFQNKYIIIIAMSLIVSLSLSFIMEFVWTKKK